MSKTARLALAVLFVLAAALPARANLVANGDFAEGSGAGWTFAVQSVGIGSGAAFSNLPCPGCSPFAGLTTQLIGGQFAWSDPIDIGYGTISQTLATTPGQAYTIQYQFAVEGESAGNFFAAFNGTAVLPSGASLAHGAPVPTNYLQTPPDHCGVVTSCGLFYGGGGIEIELESFTLVATNALTVLEFAGACPGCNFFVTDVSVNPLPEPGTLTLFGVGLGAPALLWLRRRGIRHAVAAGPAAEGCTGRA